MPEGWTEVSTSWVKENSYIATSANGGTVQMGTIDGKPGIGPMSLLLAAVAGCTGMDIVDILKKKKIDLQDFKIKVRGHRAGNPPPSINRLDHVAFSTSDAESLRSEALAKLGLERGVGESAGQMLGDDRLLRAGRHRVVDGQRGAARHEGRGAGPAALVDDVEDRHPARARPAQGLRDAGHRLGSVGQDHLPDRGEVLLLGVDDEERGLVHRGQRVMEAGWPPTSTLADASRPRIQVSHASARFCSSTCLSSSARSRSNPSGLAGCRSSVLTT